MHTYFRDIAALTAGVVMLGSFATFLGLLSLAGYLAYRLVTLVAAIYS